MAHALILFTVIALATTGCKKTNDSPPISALQSYMAQMAGHWTLYGTETDSMTSPPIIFPTPRTSNTSETYEISVVNDTTVSFVTSDTTSVNNIYYLTDTDRYLVSVNVATNEITFASEWFSASPWAKYYYADVFDTVIYNYTKRTVTERENVVEDDEVWRFYLQSP